MHPIDTIDASVNANKKHFRGAIMAPLVRAGATKRLDWSSYSPEKRAHMLLIRSWLPKAHGCLQRGPGRVPFLYLVNGITLSDTDGGTQ